METLTGFVRPPRASQQVSVGLDRACFPSRLVWEQGPRLDWDSILTRARTSYSCSANETHLGEDRAEVVVMACPVPKLQSARVCWSPRHAEPYQCHLWKRHALRPGGAERSQASIAPGDVVSQVDSDQQLAKVHVSAMVPASLPMPQSSAAVMNRLHCATGRNYSLPLCFFLSARKVQRRSACPCYGNLSGHAHLQVAAEEMTVLQRATM